MVTLDGYAMGTVKAGIVAKGRVRAHGELVIAASLDDIALLEPLEGRLVAIMLVHEYADEPSAEQAALWDTGTAPTRYD